MFGGRFGRVDSVERPGSYSSGGSRAGAPDAGGVVPFAVPDFRGWATEAMDAYVRVHLASCQLEQRKLEVRMRELDLEVARESGPSSGPVTSPASVPRSGASSPLGSARLGGLSQVARVGEWRSKVVRRASSLTSWRSGPGASSSGFSTVGGEAPASEPACSGGRCYAVLAAEGCRSTVVRRCGKWPAVSRLLALPAAEVSMAKLSEHVLVRSVGNCWHVASADLYPPATATVSDVLGRLVREFDDALQVGDPRWAGTLLEAVASRPEPLGTFDLPDLSSRVGASVAPCGAGSGASSLGLSFTPLPCPSEEQLSGSSMGVASEREACMVSALRALDAVSGGRGSVEVSLDRFVGVYDRCGHTFLTYHELYNHALLALSLCAGGRYSVRLAFRGSAVDTAVLRVTRNSPGSVGG